MNSSVTITTHKVRSPSGKRYVYHQLRWFGPEGPHEVAVEQSGEVAVKGIADQTERMLREALGQ